MQVALEQAGGGRLMLTEEMLTSGERAYVLKDGLVMLDLGTLKRWASLNGDSREGAAFVVPQMPPGHYSLCQGPPREETCSGGQLAPYGLVDLTTERNESNESTKPDALD